MYSPPTHNHRGHDLSNIIHNMLHQNTSTTKQLLLNRTLNSIRNLNEKLRKADNLNNINTLPFIGLNNLLTYSLPHEQPSSSTAL